MRKKMERFQTKSHNVYIANIKLIFIAKLLAY